MPGSPSHIEIKGGPNDGARIIPPSDPPTSNPPLFGCFAFLFMALLCVAAAWGIAWLIANWPG